MSKRFRKQSASAVSVLLASSMLMTACGGSTPAEQPAAAPAKTDTAPAKSEPAAAPAAGSTEYDQALAGKFKGTKVTMFGPFTDADQVKFETSIKEFEGKTGIDIQYEGSKEFEATISIRVDGGNAPDIADFPQPGLLGSFAKKGKVIDVNKVMDVNAAEEELQRLLD
ncbi:extracellular solute-binding protein [Paenibacillus mucilaginosus]|uniref:extracellular solute-binding protein n=1 Tax=Paenibacillus mucilaginosus TaxID=61624 RepID=UPI0002F2FE74|nr:extracellular solute-binding protein [Paenibacillus mucilaginosus]